MAVKIRLKRMGRRHRPYYRIGAFDTRTPRDGKCLEILGTYDPLAPTEDKQVTLKPDRMAHWLSNGALPSETVGSILKRYNISTDSPPAPDAAEASQ